jgi:hypothetical protein
MAKEFERTETKTTTKPAPTDQSTTAFGYADLSWVTTGERPVQIAATSLARKDGHFLGYRGKRVNVIYGDPEACKSWLTYFAMKAELEQGGNCLLLNLDNDDETEVVDRLELLGVEGSVIADPSRFRIYQPESAKAIEAVLPETKDFRPSMVSIDSFGGLLTMLDFDSLKDNDVRKCWNENIQPFGNRDNGCAVWVTDHLTKRQTLGRNTDSPYGSAAKKQLVRGSLIRAEVKELLAPESTGRVSLWVEKDNSGRVRQFCKEKLFGSFEIDATDPERISAHIDTPSEVEAAKDKFRPTYLMEKVSEWLVYEGCTSKESAPSTNIITTSVKGKADAKRTALQRLVEEGYVERIEGVGRGGGSRFWSLRPYTERTDPLLGNLNLVPTSSQQSWEQERTLELSDTPKGVRSSEVQGEEDDDDGLAAWRQPLPPQGGAA